MKKNLRNAQLHLKGAMERLVVAIAEIERAAGDAATSEKDRANLFEIRQWLRQTGSDAHETEKRIEEMLQTIRLREESEADHA